MNKGQLKPCPFCGSKDIEFIDEGFGQNRVECSDCAVCMELFSNDIPAIQDARDKWNRRDKPRETPFIGLTNKIYDSIVVNGKGNIFRRGVRWTDEAYVGVGRMVRLGRGGQPGTTMIAEVCDYIRKQTFKFNVTDRAAIKEQYKFNHKAERFVTRLAVTIQQ